jgi:O-antigen ligase
MLTSVQVMVRSRAGMILGAIALVGGFTLTQWNGRSARRATRGRTLLLGAVVVGAVFSAQYGLHRALERFGSDPLADARVTFARNTIEAARAVTPFGAGMGAFVPVYSLFERPTDILPGLYANHAHNDFLELWLEAGASGLLLTGMFVTWLLLRWKRVWRRSFSEGLEIDRSLMRASTLIVALLLLHSFVDYPLRTGAMMAIFAFACALLVSPQSRSDSEVMESRMGKNEAPKRRVRSLAPIRSISSHSVASAVANPKISPPSSWCNSVTEKGAVRWPTEWRKLPTESLRASVSSPALVTSSSPYNPDV